MLTGMFFKNFLELKKLSNDFFMALIFGFEVGGGRELFLKLHEVNEFLNIWCQT